MSEKINFSDEMESVRNEKYHFLRLLEVTKGELDEKMEHWQGELESDH